MKTNLMIVSALMISFTANAQTPKVITPKEVAEIKAIIPQGKEIAGAYGQDFDAEGWSFKLRQGEEYFTAVSASVLKQDFNDDGVKDLVVAIEDEPSAPDAEGNRAVGDRKVLVYLSQANGELRLVATADKAIYNADEGGTFGEPFEGIAAGKASSFYISHYGGSSHRWSYTDQYQLRDGEFMLIGTNEFAYWTGDLSGERTDINLITGRVEKTKMVEGATRKKRVSYQPRVPLKSLAQSEVGGAR